MSKPATIKDIALKVGVSETTISRYLNGKYHYMSEKTREKIAIAIKELDYRPNNMARSLKSQKSKMIGAIIADISNPFSAIIIKGLSDECEKRGYTLLIAISDNSAINERKHIEKFRDNQVDGLIINTSGDNEAYLKKMSDTNFPLILLDRGVSGSNLDVVTTDNYTAVIEMMSFLISQGCQSVAFFVDKLSNTVRKDRLRAFKDSVGELNSVVYINQAEETQMIRDALKDFKTYPEPRVIFGANGSVTLTILEVMNRENYLVNQDFGICGFDDLPWAKIVTPELTTIDQDSYALGRESIAQLIEKINRPQDRPQNKGKVTAFPATLKIRESTKLKQ